MMVSERSPSSEGARAQSEAIGFVLLFAVLLTAAVGWQVGVVPDQNERVEYNHVQDVQSQMVELGATVGSIDESSGPQDVAVSLGNRFPDRTLFVNPPPTSGRLRTLGDGATPFAANVTNATALDPEVDDYWTGENRSFATAAFVYDPGLQAHESGPARVVFENSLVYSTYDDYVRQHASQGIVNGRVVSLAVVNGSYSEAASGSTTPTDVRLHPASASPTTVRVTNDSGPVQVRVPTNLERDAWVDRLGDEFDPSGTNPDAYVEAVEVKDRSIGPEGWDLLVLTLEEGETYSLQLSKVRVGSPPPNAEPPAYVATTAGWTATIREGTDHRVTFEVRDRYDNPVSNASVNVSLVGPGNLTTAGTTNQSFTNLRTDVEGKVTLTYAVNDVTDGQRVEVRVNRSGGFSGSFDSDRPSNANVSFTVIDADADDGGGSGTGGGTYMASWPTPSEIVDRSGKITLQNGNLTVDRDSTSLVRLNATTGDFSGAPVEFSVSDESVLAVKNATPRSNDAGDASVNLTVNQRGWAYVYVTGGGTGDRIRVVVEQRNRYPEPAFSFEPSNPKTKDTVSFDASASTDADGSIQSYQWDFGDGTAATGETVTHHFDAGTYTVTLTVTDDDGGTNSTTQTVMVDQYVPPYFEISSFTTPDTAAPGETITMSATVENVGDTADTQFVDYAFNASPPLTVAVVDDGSVYGSDIATTLRARLPSNYDVVVVDTQTAVNEMGSYDAVVVQRLGTDTALASQFVNAVDQGNVGAVYLDQWTNDPSAADYSDGIRRLAGVRDDPSGVSNAYQGTPPIVFDITQDHPIFDGVGDVGDTITIHESATDDNADRVWVSGYSGTVLAQVHEQSAGSYDGPTLLVNDDANEVLLGMGRSRFIPNEQYTSKANDVLANAVEHVAVAAGTPSDTTEVTLVPGETRTFSYQVTVPNAVGQYGYRFATANESVVDAVTVSTSSEYGSFSGAISDATAGVALANTQVTFSLDGASYTTTTDANGEYELTTVPAGTYTAIVDAAGYYESSPFSLTVTDGGSTMGVDVSLTQRPPAFQSLSATANEQSFFGYQYADEATLNYGFASSTTVDSMRVVVVDSSGTEVVNDTFSNPSSPTTVSYEQVQFQPVTVRITLSGPGGDRCYVANLDHGQTISLTSFSTCGGSPNVISKPLVTRESTFTSSRRSRAAPARRSTSVEVSIDTHK